MTAAPHNGKEEDFQLWLSLLDGDRFYGKFREGVRAGKQPSVQPENLRRRVEELTARLKIRQQELEQQRHIVSATPVIVGGALIMSAGLLARLRGKRLRLTFPLTLPPAPKSSAAPCRR